MRGVGALPGSGVIHEGRSCHSKESTVLTTELGFQAGRRDCPGVDSLFVY
jgi:hypothetical protein